MPKRTLLDMTQDIIRSMKLDAVNSLSESSEALLIASVIKNSYYGILTNRDIPELNKLSTLTALGDSTKPTIMKYPDAVDEVFWLKYDKREDDSDTKIRFEDVKWRDPDSFIRLVNGFDSTDTATVGQQTDPTSGLTLLYKKDANPSFFTSLDDTYVIFDSYDADIDDTLVSAKTQLYIRKDPTFTISDSFIPDLDSSLFPLLFNVSKAAATIEIKGEQAPVATSLARSQVIASQRTRHRTRVQNTPGRPGFGRK